MVMKDAVAKEDKARYTARKGASGGKTNAQMKEYGCARAKLVNQYGSTGLKGKGY